MNQVLQLCRNGFPQHWISPQEAATQYASGSVAWTVGDVYMTLRGGTNAQTGRQSLLDLHPIIALNGSSRVNQFDLTPALTNRKLFVRDRMTCTYCGRICKAEHLTRDHIIPLSRKGADRWENVTSSCRTCNGVKDARTPEEANMPLLFLPYVPSLWEDFLLAGRNVRADVHDWLRAKLPKGSRLA